MTEYACFSYSFGLVVIDAQDVEWYRRYAWKMLPNGYVYRGTSVYVLGQGKVSRNVYLHREIMDLQYSDVREVDHLDRNKLDNRRSNLEIVSKEENLSRRGLALMWDKSARGAISYE